MAKKKLKELCNRLRVKWADLHHISIKHRLGQGIKNLNFPLFSVGRKVVTHNSKSDWPLGLGTYMLQKGYDALGLIVA